MTAETLTASVPASAKPPRRLGPRRGLGLVAGLVLLALTVFASLALGAVDLAPGDVLAALAGRGSEEAAWTVLQLRLPRTLLGLLAGVALALAGVLMQTMSRNPLADPGLLGVNAGASLAVVLGIAFLGAAGTASYVWLALVGAAIATVAVYALATAGSAGPSPARMVLAGAAVAAVLTGFISAIVLVSPVSFGAFQSWNVGTLSGKGMGAVVQVLPFIAVGVVLALAMAHSLNAIAMGDDQARSIGARVGWIRFMGVLTTTILCGAATAAVGPIGFIGLVVPHMVRAITGPDHRWLLPYSAITGPVILLASDVVGRLLSRPGELSTGLITAAIGAPVFIALLRRRRLAEL